MVSSSRKYTLVFVSLIALAGCTTGPDYVAPQPVVPGAWSSESGEAGLPASESAIAEWWTQFGDVELDRLIEDALGANQDLRVAQARLGEARALRGVGVAALSPTVDVKGSVERSRAREGGGEGGAASTGEREQTRYEMGFDAGWELDIFGGRRRALEAVDADLGAAEEALAGVRVTLVAEVARNFMELRGTQMRLGVARQNRDAQQALVSITESRYRAGLATELEVKQAQGQLSSAASTIPPLESQVLASIYGLGVLIGQQPAALVERLSPEAPLPAHPPIVPVGLPSDLLRRRPDIRQSERELAAASARVAEATADLYPKFSLTGSFGASSNDTAGLNLGSGSFWSIGPAVSFPLFDAGRVRANIAIQNARTEGALARYELSVNRALEDAEKSLTAYAKEQQRREILVSTVRVARDAVDIATEMYTKGLVSFLDVIQSQNALFDAEDRRVESEMLVLQDLIAVYKALGGGWEAPPPHDS